MGDLPRSRLAERFRPVNGVRSTVDPDGGAILLDQAGGTFLGLNALGARVWACIEAGESVGNLALTIARTHGRQVWEVEGDVATFVEDLLRRGLIRRLEQSAKEPASE